MKRPPALTALITLLDSTGWSYSLQHGLDSSGHPFITINGIPHWDDITAIRATWHTRNTGTLRLFSCMARQPYRGWRDMPLSKIRRIIAPQPAQDQSTQPERSGATG